MSSEPITVLVAEDLDILRENLVEMLNHEVDIEVLGAAASGKEIVELAKEYEPEIILMDVEMETKDAGIVAANTIFAEHPDVKIIFLTMHEDDYTVIEAMSTGAVDYIFKTADCTNAITHIRQAHRNRIELEAAIQRIMHGEYVRMLKSKQDYMQFMRKIMLLTPSETEIIRLLLKKRKVADIAAARFVEPVTIKKQIGQLLKKLDAKRTREVVSIIEELHIESLFLPEL
ncbi:MAG: response regulator transcription factor [Sphaerochaetaceae bacterium]|nr:response regulator transcription factor [Sphaerochaetaceae bacterium]